jgi:hypothetical protein
VRFAVVSRSQEPEIRRILLDKEPATFEVVVESAGLEEDELERLLAEEEGNQPPDASRRRPCRRERILTTPDDTLDLREEAEQPTCEPDA